MKGKLSTHVLDASRGRSTAGVSIGVWRLEKDNRHFVKMVVTNADGRTDEPLLIGAELRKGKYELLFQVGPYSGARAENPILNEIPIRFRVLTSEETYHVRLPVIPWPYSTYREVE
jgi:5-hydroxyisourate hydrolase